MNHVARFLRISAEANAHAVYNEIFDTTGSLKYI